MKKYTKPEFKAVQINAQDVITSSLEGDEGQLPNASSGWETSGNIPVIGL